MPVGVIIDVSAVFLGGLLGGYFGSSLPIKLKNDLTLIFGVSSMAMGITYLFKVRALPAVILSVILGLAAGEWIHLNDAIELGATKAEKPISTLFPNRRMGLSSEAYMQQLISVIVLFCASGTGIFGALESGMSGDHTVLCTKAILDFFTAAIFASSLGPIVAFVGVPQLVIQLVLFYSAGLILPLTTDAMRADFTACGGLMMLATGLRIAGIKSFPIADMLPAMVLVMPISAFWTNVVGALIH